MSVFTIEATKRVRKGLGAELKTFCIYVYNSGDVYEMISFFAPDVKIRVLMEEQIDVTGRYLDNSRK